MQRLLLVAFAAVLMLGTTVAKAEYVVNGSFENPVVTDLNRWHIYESIEGWEKTFGSGIEIQRDGVAGLSYDGRQHVELDANFNSGMKQAIQTVADQWYELSFYSAPRPGMSALTNGIDVLWNNTKLNATPITGDGGSSSSSPTVWTLHKYSVRGTGLKINLEFQATTASDSYGGYLDAVSMIAIPEASSIAGWSLLGIVSAGIWRWRKRKA